MGCAVHCESLGNAGNIHMPSHRLEQRSSKSLFCRLTNTCDSVNRTVLGRGFFIGSNSGCRARQKVFTGHNPHLGIRLTQIVAPRSMRAELNRPGSFVGRSSAATCQSRLRPAAVSTGFLILNNRASNRVMFASTMGARRSKAKVATAFAV